MKPSSPVSRSVYQKLAEENKRLMRDIKVMACGECFEAIQMRLKWRKFFREKEEWDKAFKEALGIIAKRNKNI